MSDTVPIYIFSVFNKEGKRFNMKYFMLVNFFAGVTRAVILYVLAELFGINLFG
jgi:ABC-type maltose transport system permease subunit